MILLRLNLKFPFFGRAFIGLLQGPKAAFDGLQSVGFGLREAITGRKSHVLFHVALLIELRCCFTRFGDFDGL